MCWQCVSQGAVYVVGAAGAIRGAGWHAARAKKAKESSVKIDATPAAGSPPGTDQEQVAQRP